MSARQLIGVLALGAGAWGLLKVLGVTTLPADLLTAPTALPWLPAWPFPADPTPSDYTTSTAARESAGSLNAKNPRSTASGKYQFTQATWRSVGGAWGSDASKPFGGLTPSEAEQDQRFATLTRSNASGLARAGIAATNAALYAAHFLGLATALRVLAAAPSTSLASLIGSKAMAANPQLKGFSVADFRTWLGAQA